MDNNHNSKPQGNNIPNLEIEIERKKMQAFELDLTELQAKHGFIIVPIQHTTQFGTMLDIAYMRKEDFERQMKAGLMASGAKLSTDQKPS